MKVLRGSFWDWAPPDHGTVAAIGVFDGMHKGHQAVIRQAMTRARDLGIPTTVVTFHPHPLQLVAPDQAPRLITSLDQRLELIAALGVEVTAVLTFDEELRSLTPDDFATDLLVGAIGTSAVVVGSDFRFGKDRAGDVQTLRTLGLGLGYYVDDVELVGDETPVSSQSIRAAVVAGDVQAAAADLGRWFEIRGTVVHGESRGSTIGFPTANLSIGDNLLVPAYGIYAAWAHIDGHRHRAAVNVGVRPTFDSDAEVVEAYLLDFEEDLYEREIAVEFVARLRDEKKFESVDALVAQITDDVAQTRRILDTAELPA